MFSEKSKFSSLLNISHKSRASGHRFRVNDITCHPVLPLLLTTSHHNVVHMTNEEQSSPDTFCSELILWRVDPVGPLSKSGGITELARINSQEISAFSDVAWIPTLLPSKIFRFYSYSIVRLSIIDFSTFNLQFFKSNFSEITIYFYLLLSRYPR